MELFRHKNQTYGWIFLEVGNVHLANTHFSQTGVESREIPLNPGQCDQ